MATFMGVGALLTVLVIVVSCALLVAAATYDALRDAWRHVKEHLLRP